jgi:serine/threonine protein kinase
MPTHILPPIGAIHPRYPYCCCLQVSDFGLAQLCPDMRLVQDAPWGTLVFQAPERFVSNVLTPACDVWSFGVTLVGATRACGCG